MQYWPSDGTLDQTKPLVVDPKAETHLAKRIVVALDVRSNDHGDLVVTKGDQYDVRENHTEGTGVEEGGRGGVRNLGKPVALASRYYKEGCDEIAFLNITSFRHGVIEDMPMLQVLEEASKYPPCYGGGVSAVHGSRFGSDLVWPRSGVAVLSSGCRQD
jgi:glutamine amidotransferase/cyclase